MNYRPFRIWFNLSNLGLIDDSLVLGLDTTPSHRQPGLWVNS